MAGSQGGCMGKVPMAATVLVVFGVTACQQKQISMDDALSKERGDMEKELAISSADGEALDVVPRSRSDEIGIRERSRQRYEERSKDELEGSGHESSGRATCGCDPLP